MRWERLFADIEQQVADEDLLERDALVAELVDEEEARTSWLDLVAGRVRLRVRGAGMVEGMLLAARPALLHVQGDGGELLVATPAVLTVTAPARRPAGTAGAVARRLGWASAWRVLRDEDADVIVVLVDGTRLAGRPRRVGSDHVELVAEGGSAELVPYAALATVRPRG